MTARLKNHDWLALTFFGSGDTGARPTKDGLSATAFPSGVLGTPVEVVETLAPLLVERKALRDDSGGDGRFRGGLGQVLGFRVLTDDPATCSVFCDRTVIPAQGFFSGRPGALGALLINGTAPANSKAEQVLQPGDLIELFMPGGGGFGPPAERDPALRSRDRLEGYTTA